MQYTVSTVVSAQAELKVMQQRLSVSACQWLVVNLDGPGILHQNWMMFELRNWMDIMHGTIQRCSSSRISSCSVLGEYAFEKS